MATLRQGRLKRECADRYPRLPARMWTSAARLAELVGFDRQAAQKTGAVKKERPLSEADFEFRGGSPRWAAGLTVQTRTGELLTGEPRTGASLWTST